MANNNVFFAKLMDISLTTEQALIGLFILVHLIVISVFNNKFQQELNKSKKFRAQLRLKTINKNQFDEAVSIHLEQIKIIKKRAYIIFATAFVVHAILVLALSFSWVTLLIVHALFFGVFFVSFWMKGATIISTLKNTPRIDPFR